MEKNKSTTTCASSVPCERALELQAELVELDRICDDRASSPEQRRNALIRERTVAADLRALGWGYDEAFTLRRRGGSQYIATIIV
jgi:hypothetical protein